MLKFTELAIPHLNQLIFGTCPHPLKLKSGLIIGGGEVYPEINFTLPSIPVTKETMAEVREQYRQMIDETVTRAVELTAPGLVVELELLPEMTIEPDWGAEITAILRERLDKAQAESGIKVGLRVTPNDIREFVRPPKMRQSDYVEKMFTSFERCAAAGADMMAIESTGGKEIHDDALLQADYHASVFALGVLGSRDMEYLWGKIVQICDACDVIPAGDSACGFANTAMVLAENRFIPKVWAAVVRVMATARSLVAYECGAVGPSKDCAYEGIYLKAITGYPISLEG
ncbi:MAG: methyltransferase MtaB domain-containing protein, partial [Anaerolineaceae bacterium]|nr:methyltransferase MtaB domain-containing protein [Anaerolineaceae bacterium]